MSASCRSHRWYSGTRYWVEKIMLRKSPPVMRTHSWARRAPMSCMERNPGMRISVPSKVACTASMRGSVS